MALVRDDFDDIPDSEIHETIVERIEGLGEMFPDALRSAVHSTVDWSIWGVKGVVSAADF